MADRPVRSERRIWSNRDLSMVAERIPGLPLPVDPRAIDRSAISSPAPAVVVICGFDYPIESPRKTLGLPQFLIFSFWRPNRCLYRRRKSVSFALNRS